MKMAKIYTMVITFWVIFISVVFTGIKLLGILTLDWREVLILIIVFVGFFCIQLGIVRTLNR